MKAARPTAAWRRGAARVAALLGMAALLAAEDRGPASILRGIFGIGLLLLGPLVGGVILGGLQHAVYRALVRSGLMQSDSVPMFPILVLRGLILLIAVIAGTLFWLKATGRSLPFTG